MASLHFLTLSNKYRLPLALIASLLLHGLPWLLNQTPPPKPAPPPPAMTAKLLPPAQPAPPPPLPPPPELILPEPPKPEASTPPRPAPIVTKQKATPAPDNSPKTWQQVIARQFKTLNDRQQYYPPEAIARGLEGEVLVLVIIDQNGNITAARVEESSGHPLLDEAALRNVRTIRSLPADAPREALLPLRFRLR